MNVDATPSVTIKAAIIIEADLDLTVDVDGWKVQDDGGSFTNLVNVSTEQAEAAIRTRRDHYENKRQRTVRVLVMGNDATDRMTR